ncbi:hypothetical protein Tco_0820538 [Tanacetum coccineum]|uniref:DUF4283 domain-containing protein n=1 Tax=Tanacetum coccineum TaxID=301880 RepID=A0ABQ5AE00_9ASTR
MVLERGSLNYGGDPVLVGYVTDFKTLPNIHNVCLSEGFSGWNAQTEIPDRVVRIDVEGTSLQAWSHATFNRIASKWGELAYMDESNASNKYSMRICVKTRVHHLVVECFKVILEGKVLVVRAKEVTRWVPDFEEDDIAQSKEGSDNNSVENSHDDVENSLDHVKNYDVHVVSHPDNGGNMRRDGGLILSLNPNMEDDCVCNTNMNLQYASRRFKKWDGPKIGGEGNGYQIATSIGALEMEALVDTVDVVNVGEWMKENGVLELIIWR